MTECPECVAVSASGFTGDPRRCTCDQLNLDNPEWLVTDAGLIPWSDIGDPPPVVTETVDGLFVYTPEET